LETVKEKLLEEKKELKDKNIIFLLDGKELNLDETLKKNQIKKNKTIVINIQKYKLSEGKKEENKNIENKNIENKNIENKNIENKNIENKNTENKNIENKKGSK